MFFSTFLKFCEDFLSKNKLFRDFFAKHYLELHEIITIISLNIIRAFIVNNDTYTDDLLLITDTSVYAPRNLLFSYIKNGLNIFRFGDFYNYSKKITFNLFSALVRAGFITKKSEKKPMGGGKFTTYIFYRLSSFLPPSPLTRLYSNINIFGYSRISDDYLMGNSYLSLTFCLKKRFDGVNFNRLCIWPLVKISSFEYKLDRRLEFILKNYIEEEFGGFDLLFNKILLLHRELKPLIIKHAKINSVITSLLKKNSNANMEVDYKTSDISISDSLELDVVENRFSNKEKLIWWLKEKKLIRLKIGRVSKRINLLTNLAYISLAYKYFDSFYLPHFYDSRGRIYSKSVLSPTNNKLIRIFIKLSKRGKDFSDEAFYKFIIKVPLSGFELKIFNKNFLLKNITNQETKYLCIIYLIEIAKLFKSELLRGAKFSVSILEFIRLACNKINGCIEFRDEYDRFTFQKYCFSIFEVLNGGIGGFSIFKDSTASAFQHWSLNLGSKPSEDYVLNMKGFLWSDLYTYSINTFLRSSPKYKVIFKFINRKLLKRSIMTVGYNVTFYSFLAYYLSELDNYLISNNLSLSEEEAILVKEFAKRFFDYLYSEFFLVLYNKDRKSFIDSLDPLNIGVGGNSFNFAYTKVIGVKADVYGRGSYRIVIKRNVFSLEEIDHKATRRGLDPNLIQAYDACLARYLISQDLDLVSIHDEFGVSDYELPYLINHVNAYFNSEKKVSNFAIFILL